jgi:hypothetical protein
MYVYQQLVVQMAFFDFITAVSCIVGSLSSVPTTGVDGNGSYIYGASGNGGCVCTAQGKTEPTNQLTCIIQYPQV